MHEHNVFIVGIIVEAAKEMFIEVEKTVTSCEAV